MCGLVGVVGTGINNADIKVFNQLLYADEVRGKHSTGVAAVEYDGTCHVAKRAVCARDFLDMPRMTKEIDASKWALLGHNRHATQGNSGAHANAHPFEHGAITLMHNGTLSTREGLKDSHKFQVDSENIAYTFSIKHYMDVLPNLNGAFALVWHNAADNTVRFVRNDERPLAIATSKHRNVMYYASEMDMLKWVLKRNDISAEYVTVKPGKVWTIESDMSVSSETVKLKDPYAGWNSSYGGYNNVYSGGWGGSAYGRLPVVSSVTESEKQLEEMGYKVGDSCITEILTSDKVSSAKKSKFRYYGLVFDQPDIDVYSYGHSNANEHNFYKGKIKYCYLDKSGRLCVTLTDMTPIDDASPELSDNSGSDCSCCGHVISDGEESLFIEEWGSMHNACYKELMHHLNVPAEA